MTHTSPARVSASWVVPAIAGRSPIGDADTWIAADSAGVSSSAFIQVGTDEARLPERYLSESTAVTASTPGPYTTSYRAFWSDGFFKTVPEFLFSVDAGDLISASLEWTERGWIVAIRDETSGRERQFIELDHLPLHAYSRASWVQEDPDGQPYPTLTPVRFNSLRLNGRTPAYTHWEATAMAPANQPGTLLEPTIVRAGSFSQRTIRLGPSAARLLAEENGSFDARSRFGELEQSWKSTSPITVIRSQIGALVAPLTADARYLTSIEFADQGGLLRDVRERVADMLAVADHPPSDPTARGEWEQRWAAATSAYSTAWEALWVKVRGPGDWTDLCTHGTGHT